MANSVTLRTFVSGRRNRVADHSLDFKGVPAVLAAFLAVMVSWERRIGERDLIGQMDRRHLNDIGMAPAYAVDVASRPFWQA